MNGSRQPAKPAEAGAPRGQRSPGPRLLLAMALFLRLMIAPPAFGFDPSADTWALLMGYGQSIPDWGRTSQRVETVDLVPRYSHLTIDSIGSGWYRGYHSTLFELPLHLVASPDESVMIGLNVLACYTFTASDQWRPYVFGGGGPVYSFADIPGMGADLNGNYQFGLGLEHPYGPMQSLLVELRYHHISNAGTEDPNDPLNSIKLLFGLTF